MSKLISLSEYTRKMKIVIRNDCELIEKTQIIPNVYFLKYSFGPGLEWIPGQYVGITVNPTYRRSYSILDYDGQNLSFLIDTKPGGIASKFFDSVEVGHKNQILGPYGRFILQNTVNEKVFVSTGTGIAPFIPMIKELRNSNLKIRIKIFSGSKTQDEDIAFRFVKQYLNDKFEYHQCITREEPKAVSSKLITHKGRVTEVIPQQNLDWQSTEFYICGSPAMVRDTEKVLKDLGTEKVFIEQF